VVGFVVEFYRQIGRGLAGAPLADATEPSGNPRQAIDRFGAGEEAAAACAERSLEALGHIDRNANQATWIEAWLDDLARLAERSAA
jgi:hypothetical protein